MVRFVVGKRVRTCQGSEHKPPISHQYTYSLANGFTALRPVNFREGLRHFSPHDCFPHIGSLLGAARRFYVNGSCKVSEFHFPRAIESCLGGCRYQKGFDAMRSWTTKEAKLVLEWARQPDEGRTHIDEVAAQLSRSTRAVQEFLRRVLPEGQRPWAERPRWGADEIAALQLDVGTVSTRSAAAIKQYVKRHHCIAPTCSSDEDSERTALSVTQVARDLGLSRASVYRLLKRGALRRFKGGVAETSFNDLLREHPEAVPYSRLPRDQREWLVLNGYSDSSLSVKRPSVRGILD